MALFYIVFTAFTLLLVLIDAWHDVPVIKLKEMASRLNYQGAKMFNTQWHFRDNVLKGLSVAVVALLLQQVFLQTFNIWVFIWSLAHFFLFVRFGVFNLFLNAFRKLRWDHKGSGGIDGWFENAWMYIAFNLVMLLILSVFYWHVMPYSGILS